MTQPKIRIKDLANALGISVGTVDRALKNRPEVSATTRERVLKLAEASGYRPDPLASALATRKRLRVAVVLPRGVTPFHKEVRAGIENEHAERGENGVDLEYHTFPRLGSGDSDAIRKASQKHLDGLIVSSSVDEETHDAIRTLLNRAVAVVCVGTNLPSLHVTADVAIDPAASGCLAGDLIGSYVQQDGPIAVVTGDLSVTNHREKVEKFQETIRHRFPGRTVLPVVEAYDDRAMAYSRASQLFRSHRNLAACYISTGNSSPVLKAMIESIPARPFVITTDLFPELSTHIREGRVFGTLYQRPRTQGALAYRALHHQFHRLAVFNNSIRLDPQLITRSTLEGFLRQRLS